MMARFTEALHAVLSSNGKNSSSNNGCGDSKHGYHDIYHENYKWESMEKCLQKRRDHVTSSFSSDNSWDSFSSSVISAFNSQCKLVLSQYLRLVSDMLGGDKPFDSVKSAAMWLINSSISTPSSESSHSLQSHENQCRIRFASIFGSVSTTQYNAVLVLLVTIRAWQAQLDVTIPAITSSSEDLMPHEFGYNIPFTAMSNRHVDYVETEAAVMLFSRNDKQRRHNTEPTEYISKEQGGDTNSEDYDDVCDTSWLKRRSESFIALQQSPSGDGIIVEQLCLSLFEALASPRSDEALQDELFQMLGFDSFDFVLALLKHRKHIISLANEAISRRSKDDINNGSEGVNAGSFGCQVTVSSETELRMQKVARKEERRHQQKARKGDITEASSRDLLSVLGFGVEEGLSLRERRERDLALGTAGVAPSSSSGLLREADLLSARGSTIRFPHVYDASSRGHKGITTVCGQKMMLPEGTTRSSTKKAEIVSIPPSLPLASETGESLVPISKLSPIAQLAFDGISHLNRIQSIVYPTAYHTNSNMLVCAPTGAGKTNVALLTILHEIMKNLHGGVVKKDSFKIIYVAPMKALAAEMVRNFGKRLGPLGITVAELTGDMQLTKAEIMRTQMIVTTPEKWDVITRKGSGDVAFTQLVKLIIIDEVHLLHDDRGPVIETLVARTLRQVESSQSMIRIVGLSATLPNYIDVALMLRVNPEVGLFYFDGSFRPVPLSQEFIGIKTTNRLQFIADMNEECYNRVKEQVALGYQVMVFVHSRNDTVKTATMLRDTSQNRNETDFFAPDENNIDYLTALKRVERSMNKSLKELFPTGFGMHHAGMLRCDRTLTEYLFSKGLLRVLCSTATLAWGVNLPAHAVVIKGTQIYDAKRGSFVDLGILDVQQIFGRAGRPQFDQFGLGSIITAHDKLNHYLSLMTQALPIESQFIKRLGDNLNAEIALGTVTSIDEAVQWLSYTYLFVRMLKNPLAYGLTQQMKKADHNLFKYRTELVIASAKGLDKCRMVRFDERTGIIATTDLGRIASHFYIGHVTIDTFNANFKEIMTEADLIALVSQSSEFDNIKVRDEELPELDRLVEEVCVMPVKGGSENCYGKVNILLQAYVCKAQIEAFSLVSDMAYVAQNSARILRALFEIARGRGWPLVASKLLTLCKTVDRRQWSYEHPLRQFDLLSRKSPQVLSRLEGSNMSIDRLRDMSPTEIGHLVHHVNIGALVSRSVAQFPTISMSATVHPITRMVLRVQLTIMPDFEWLDSLHGTSDPWWIWVEDAENEHIYHTEYLLLQKKHTRRRGYVNDDENNESKNIDDSLVLVFTIPIFEPLPPQYFIRAVSDRWLGAEAILAIDFRHLVLPQEHPPHTELLQLQPLPITALDNPLYEELYPFTHMNPVQTQAFHTVFHTDYNVLLGAPTGSGKTMVAEIASFRTFNCHPGKKVVYIAPLKALVRERVDDWKNRFERHMGKVVVELTGDVSPDVHTIRRADVIVTTPEKWDSIRRADVIVTTPEKWDSISRSWQSRNYVKDVALIIIDEIHLLGGDRGPVLEAIVSRMNYMSAHTNHTVRLVGLSTALANARDLADWLSIDKVGLFNFRPAVRPVQLRIHIQGFAGRHYCPRMATMNKPAFQAIKQYSPDKPVLVFVSSRRQTRLTAMDIVSFCAAEANPKPFLHMPEEDMSSVLCSIQDENLQLALQFGIGLHHAGLPIHDRGVVEELFVNQKIQVLIATSTLAWGINTPAHLVIVKGTEFFDGKTQRYIDYPVTDVMQMAGRAGRPQYDDTGEAVLLVHDVKKHFYKKFLFDPFPVESNMQNVLHNHINAEVVSGTISSKQDAVNYLSWTYFYRRIVLNPSYYGLIDASARGVNVFLSELVERTLTELERVGCLVTGGDKGDNAVNATSLGRIASYYYIHYRTIDIFTSKLSLTDCTVPILLDTLCASAEFDELPVRHNEDQMNAELSQALPLPVDKKSFDSPHVKAHLLLQAHFTRTVELPIADYVTDTKSVLDQAVRVTQAMIDVCASNGWLASTLSAVTLLQMMSQGRWFYSNPLMTLPHVNDEDDVSSFGEWTLVDIVSIVQRRNSKNLGDLRNQLKRRFSGRNIDDIFRCLSILPLVKVDVGINDENGGGVFGETPSLRADEEYSLSVSLTQSSKKMQAYTPCFTKSKEGWFLIIGNESIASDGTLGALKRVSFRRSTNVTLSFRTPLSSGRYTYILYIISDVYQGLDQRIEFRFIIL